MDDFPWGSFASNALGAAATIYSANQNKKAIENATRQQQEAASAGSRRLSELMSADPTSLPGYSFAKKEGDEAVLRNLRATGQLQSGAALKALQDRGTDLANQYYGQNFNRALNVTQGMNTLGSSGAGYGAGGTLAQTQNQNSMLGGIADIITSPSAQKSIKDLIASFSSSYNKPKATSWNGDYTQYLDQGVY